MKRTPKTPEERLALAEQRLRELCQMVNTLAGFRKVRADDYLDGVDARS